VKRVLKFVWDELSLVLIGVVWPIGFAALDMRWAFEEKSGWLFWLYLGLGALMAGMGLFNVAMLVRLFRLQRQRDALRAIQDALIQANQSPTFVAQWSNSAATHTRYARSSSHFRWQMLQQSLASGLNIPSVPKPQTALSMHNKFSGKRVEIPAPEDNEVSQ